MDHYHAIILQPMVSYHWNERKKPLVVMDAGPKNFIYVCTIKLPLRPTVGGPFKNKQIQSHMDKIHRPFHCTNNWPSLGSRVPYKAQITYRPNVSRQHLPKHFHTAHKKILIQFALSYFVTLTAPGLCKTTRWLKLGTEKTPQTHE